MTPDPVTLVVDSREPWPHPWERWLPSHVRLVRATLETGDLALAGLEGGAVVERKTCTDFLACVGANRDRFDRELARARHLAGFVIVVEAGLAQCLASCRSLHPSAVLGSIAAWTRRGAPVVFAGSEELAAAFALRYLVGQVAEAHRIVTAVGCAVGTPVTGPVRPPRMRVRLRGPGIPSDSTVPTGLTHEH